MVFKIKDYTEQRLTAKGLYYGDAFIKRVIMLYEAIIARHGIMLVGAPATGKTTVFKIMRDVAKYVHNLEFRRR
jgi:type IV secretory pathway ATPase VirB11/archaellum biosynthesis ATPase